MNLNESEDSRMILTIYRIAVLVSIVATFVTGMCEAAICLPIASVCLVLMASYLVGGLICLRLPYAWTCDWAGTHAPDGKLSFDGCSQHSICRKCGANIMQDGQGNWF